MKFSCFDAKALFLLTVYERQTRNTTLLQCYMESFTLTAICSNRATGIHLFSIQIANFQWHEWFKFDFMQMSTGSVVATNGSKVSRAHVIHFLENNVVKWSQEKNLSLFFFFKLTTWCKCYCEARTLIYFVSLYYLLAFTIHIISKLFCYFY